MDENTKKQKSEKRIFGLLITLNILLLGYLIFQILTILTH